MGNGTKIFILLTGVFICVGAGEALRYLAGEKAASELLASIGLAGGTMTGLHTIFFILNDVSKKKGG